MRALALALTLTLVAAPALHARKAGGHDFSETLEVDGKALVLNGIGERLATIFNVKVYTAGLYLEHKATSSADLLQRDEAWRLVMRFHRDINKDQLNDSIVKAMEKNKMTGMEKKLAEFAKGFQDIKDGQVVRITYIPGKGTNIVSGDKGGRTIAGARFAKALLSGWVGVPPNKELKQGLLGG